MYAQRTSTTHVAIILTEPEARRLYEIALDASQAVYEGSTRRLLVQVATVLEGAIGATVDESRG